MGSFAMATETPFDPELAGFTHTRLEWKQVPPRVRRSIERRLGAPVERSESQRRGFSPALASRLTVGTGDRVFAKAIAPDAESGAPGGQDLYRQEARITALLPDGAPVPRLLDSWEEGGWVVLVFEDVDGRHPALPWDRAELESVLDALSRLSTDLTPSPVPGPPAQVPGGRDWWSELAVDRARLDRIPGLDPWIKANVDLLAATGASSGSPFSGSTLLHTDIRADNVLFVGRRVMFVDWPHARVGAPWIELVFFLPSVAMQGGPDPELLFWRQPSTIDADPSSVLAVLAGLAGFFIHGATEDPPPGLPTLRRFQLAQGIEAVNWLRRMMG
jgi:aminoglycoside phosphotransferase (APT) family kinase protein